MRNSFVILFAGCSIALGAGGTVSPGGGTIAGGGSGSSTTLSAGQSNQVVTIVNTVAPTNSGITAAQAGTQIDSTNIAVITPAYTTSINTSSNSIVANLPPKGNYVALTNTTIGIIGNVLMSAGHLDTNGSPAGVWTNLQPFNLEFHVLTNAFTNVVTCEVGPLTNKDGYVFWLFGGTNQ